MSRFPEVPAAVIGVSLGGAAALLAEYEAPPAALILESVFADIGTSIDNRLRMRLGSIGSLASPLLRLQVRPLLGVSEKDFSPVHASKILAIPTLLVYGTDDRRATPAEGLSLHENSKASSEFWLIDGAAHEDFHAFLAEEYEMRVVEFLREHLPSTH